MSNIKVLAIIQARLSSSRLPKKILLEINKKSILEIIYRNLEKINSIDKVIVATSKNKSDKELSLYCKKKNFNFFEGSLKNVLNRFVKIIKIYNPKYIVRVTADCPIIDPKVLDTFIKTLKKNNLDCLFFSHPTSLLSGYDVYSSNLLLQAFKKSKSKKDEEHVGSFYIKKNLKDFKTLKVVLPKYLRTNKFKLSIDTKNDYLKIKKLFKIYPLKKIYIKKIFEILNRNPKLIIKHTKNNFSEDNRQIRKIKIDKNSYISKLNLKL